MESEITRFLERKIRLSEGETRLLRIRLKRHKKSMAKLKRIHTKYLIEECFRRIFHSKEGTWQRY